jgi:hypothetical protein
MYANIQAQPDILLFRKYPDDVRQRLQALNDGQFRALPRPLTRRPAQFASGAYYDFFPRHRVGALSRGTGQWGADELKGDITPRIIDEAVNHFTPARPLDEQALAEIRRRYAAPEQARAASFVSLNVRELTELKNHALQQGAVKTDESRVYILSEKNNWALVSENAALAKKISHVLAISQTVSLIREHMRDEGAAEQITAPPFPPGRTHCLRKCKLIPTSLSALKANGCYVKTLSPATPGKKQTPSAPPPEPNRRNGKKRNSPFLSRTLAVILSSLTKPTAIKISLLPAFPAKPA